RLRKRRWSRSREAVGVEHSSRHLHCTCDGHWRSPAGRSGANRWRAPCSASELDRLGYAALFSLLRLASGFLGLLLAGPPVESQSRESGSSHLSSRSPRPRRSPPERARRLGNAIRDGHGAWRGGDDDVIFRRHKPITSSRSTTKRNLIDDRW